MPKVIIDLTEDDHPRNGVLAFGYLDPLRWQIDRPTDPLARAYLFTEVGQALGALVDQVSAAEEQDEISSVQATEDEGFPIEDPEPDDEPQDEDQGDGYYGYSREDDFVVPATEDDYYEMRLAQSWAKRGWEPPCPYSLFGGRRVRSRNVVEDE